MQEYVYLFNEKPIEKEQISKYPVMIAIHDKIECGVVRVFESNDTFEKWAVKSRYSKQILEKMNQLKKYESSKEGYDEEAAFKENERINNAIIALMKEMNETKLTDKVLTEAHKRKLINSLFLYDGPNRLGNWRVVFFAMANLARYNFDNRASSISVNGVYALCADRRWRGRRVWVVGIAWIDMNLQALNFDNITTSVL